MAIDKPPAKFKLSEDWLATIIGLVIVAIVGSGLLGPGPQSKQLTVAPGENGVFSLPGADDYSVNAAVNGESAAITGAVTALHSDNSYRYTCDSGQLAAQRETESVNGDPVISLTNNCDGTVVLTYSRGYTIPWPPFNLFNR